jgi:ribosomal protein S14
MDDEPEMFDPRCSFCGRPYSIAKDLIAGPEGVYVCHGCVRELAALIDGDADSSS